MGHSYLFSLDLSRIDGKYVECVAVVVTATFMSSYSVNPDCALLLSITTVFEKKDYYKYYCD